MLWPMRVLMSSSVADDNVLVAAAMGVVSVDDGGRGVFARVSCGGAVLSAADVQLASEQR